jgi:rod shape-determining protein MreC
MKREWIRRGGVIAVTVAVLALPAAYVAQARMSVYEILQPGLSSNPHTPEIDPHSAAALRKQNEQLRAANALMQDRLKQFKVQVDALGDFKDMARALGVATDEAISARILRRGVNWDRGVFVIDRGRRDGIEPGSGVLAGPLVAGVVIEAGWSTSRVAELRTRGVQVPARIVETRQAGRLAGDEKGLDLMDVGTDRPTDDHKHPQVGHRVVTAGLDGVFPPGILIGEITAVERETHEIFHQIRVRGEARLNEMEMVIVLKRRPIRLDDPPPELPASITDGN